ncbi:hypothetical protein A8B78_14605 [Jannaschia sp. EhC01]|nr:hypothetical protein A8B78_14605 [Jannaschia sp. EhC01]
MMLATVGAVAPALAQVEDTFAQFEARCLTPMVEVRDSDTLGLTLMAADAVQETWMAEFREWQLVRSTPEAVVQFCAVFGPFGAEVDAWAEAARASGDWIRIDRTPETLQSTFLREPRIEVEIDRSAMPTSLTVIETNLES